MKIIARSVVSICSFLTILTAASQETKVYSPDKKLAVTITVTDGKPFYARPI